MTSVPADPLWMKEQIRASEARGKKATRTRRRRVAGRYRREIAKAGQPGVCPLCDLRLEHGEPVLRAKLGNGTTVFHAECLSYAADMADYTREYERARSSIIESKELFPHAV